jgi:hypothetical protein
MRFMDSRPPLRRLQLAAFAVLFPLASIAQPATTPDHATTLQAVRRELSPDALFHTYIDFEGGWGQVGRELTDALKGTSISETTLDLPGAFETLGISQIRALGMSSNAVAGGYDNRFFLYTPSGRAGLFSVFPGTPGPFHAAQFAPADADLVLDVRLDIPALVKMVESLARTFSADAKSADAVIAAFRDKEGNKLPQLLAYQGRVIAIVRMNPQEEIERAQAELSRELPFKFFVLLETGGRLLADTIAKDDGWLREKKNGRTYYTRKPDESGRTENVSLVVDGDQFIAASSDLAEECLAKKGGLANSPEYAAALAESASEGHVLLYMTPKFFTSVRDLSKWLFLANSGMLQRSARESLIASQLISMMPAPTKPLTSVVVARADGLLVRGHSVQSLKASLPAAALITPDFLGRLAVYAARAWAIEDTRTHETERAQKELTPSLQQVGEIAQNYFAANPEAESVTLSALKAAYPKDNLPDFSAVSSTEVEILRASDVVILEHNTLGTIQHTMPLTDTQRAIIEKNLSAIDQAAIESMIIEGSGYAYAGSLIDNGWIDPKPTSLLGEDYSGLSPTLAEPRLSVTTRGNQEVAITREPKAVAHARRAIAERQLHVQRNLSKAHTAARRYFEVSPEEYAVSFDDLAKKELKPELTPIAGENYSDLSFAREETGSVSLTHPRIGQVTYKVPPTPERIADLRARLQRLERAASEYFAKNPKAELVVGGEIYEEPAAPADASSHDEAAAVIVRDGSSAPSVMPDLTALVIHRDYETIKASLETGYEVSVPRTKTKR